MYLRHRLCLVLMWFTLAGAAGAYPEYRVTVVGPANSSVAGINQAGVVAGTYQPAPGVTRAFLNRGKGLVDLGALKGSQSSATGINDKGEVLGNWLGADGLSRGFIYSCGKARDIGAIRGRITSHTAINNAGHVTLFGIDPDTNETRGYLRAPNGALTSLGALPGIPSVNNPFALNNRNQVTGQSGQYNVPEDVFGAYVWSKGVIRDLGNLGTVPNRGNAINDRGQITGEATLATGFRDQVAFLYSNGRMVSLDDRPVTEDIYSGGAGINLRGHVVGFSNHLSGFIWRGKRMESLNALVDPRLGWNIANPRAINDAGQIAATAYRNGVQYAVRLDLIRPHPDAAPAPEADATAGMASLSQSPALEAALAKAEAQAQTREVARPVAQ
ncbi:HAF repeat-containing protein [Massilia timonae]|uniref:HAF repeat-containing protein n=1 Tax=Massilia timonae TaxID=47229 RepID=UPI002352528F|nr:HAF repeat-containing protein [Massilia timonae]